MAEADEGNLRTMHHGDHTLAALVAAKQAQGLTASLLLPARNEAATVAGVLAGLLPLREAGLVDEVIVIDSLSSDGTAEVARAAGATVADVRDVHPEVPAQRGKGEAMWRGLLASRGDLVAFCDADVLDAGPHFVIGLLAPLLIHPEVELVKGLYRRPIVDDAGQVEEHGGRVTELTARPLLNLYRPGLAQFVQPLAGEWAGRRRLLESLSFPIGYGVEIAVLVDAHDRLGMRGLAQVDLGVRTHRHQSQRALGVMAAEVATAALIRFGLAPTAIRVRQYDPGDHRALTVELAVQERPPVAAVLAEGQARSSSAVPGILRGVGAD